MPLPVATRNVHIELLDPPTGTPAVGTVKFRLPHALVDSVGNVILAPGHWTAELVDGEATIALPVNDETGVTPQDWSYTVEIRTARWSPDGSIAVPAGGTDLEFADAFAESDAPEVDAAGTYALLGDLQAHEAATTDVHGIADTAELATQTDVSDAVTAHAGDTTAVHGIADTAALATTADLADYLPLTGGTVEGDLEISDPGVKGYRFRRSGGALDVEGTGAKVFVSVWSGTNYDGTQRVYMVLENGASVLQLVGEVQWRETADGTERHRISAADGVARLGSKNGLANIQFCGWIDEPNAPTTDTWAAGDVVLDSAGVWHLCTAGGTPGTWT